MEHPLILVNLRDELIGTATKEAAHREGRLHRAFSVFLTDGDSMLIHRRAREKYHSGGLWTNACCSHPRLEEELMDAVHRRMLFELGIDCPVQEIFHFVYYQKYTAYLAEYEFDHVFLGHLSRDTPIPFNPEEIEECRWVSFPDLEEEMMRHPENFTAWFMTAAPRILETLRGEPLSL